MFSSLEISDKIQVISIMCSTLVALISIVIAISTLKQTNKITEDANRPYVAVYLELIQVTSTFTTYIVMKNFGNTGATIDSVTYCSNFKNKYSSKPFSKLENHFIAPGQSLTTACHFEKPYKPVTFKVNYHQGKKIFSESFTINPEIMTSLIFSKTTPSNCSKLEEIIVHSAQEIIRTNL